MIIVMLRKVYSNNFIAIPVIIISIIFYLNAEDIKNIKIVATGETHAMLNACDCEHEPAGGFPKRATLIHELRKQNELILLDAGGFSGGGIYDFYTEGRPRDSIRTIAAIEAMAKIGYDAVAIGDEEVQYGADLLIYHANKAGLPLVSANCMYRSGSPVTQLFRIVKKGDVTFGITAVTTTEKLFPIDTSVIIEDPVKSIQKIWKKLKKKSDYRVIISHLGEEETMRLAEHFPECDILVNGHRKMSIQPAIVMERQLVMQFGFQGKSISSVKFDPQSKSFTPDPQDWINVEDHIADDPSVLKIVSDHETDSSILKYTTLDLYLMSQCPYGLPTLKEMLDFSESFPLINLNIWFVGDVNKDGSLKSLHGNEEIEEEKVWLAVKELYPKMWTSFLYLRANIGRTVKRAVADLELDTVKVKKWVDRKGKTELTYNYQRSQRLNVDASPTVFINNYLYEPEISYMRLAKDFCEDIKIQQRPSVCDSLPECFTDSDCRMKGKIGACSPISEKKDGGKCVFKDAVKFDFTVVIPGSSLIHTENSAVTTTEELFPGSNIRIFSLASSEGKKLVKKLNPPCLPLYLFDKQVKNTANFSKIESGLIDTCDWLTFKDDVMKKHFFYKRERKAGAIELFVDPLFTKIDGVLSYVLEKYPGLAGACINPILYKDNMSNPSAEEKVRREEAVRWVVLQEKYGKKVFAEYLDSYRTQPGSSYWFSIFKEMKIDVEKFVLKVGKSQDLVQKLLDKLNRLEITEPVELLVNNQELIPIKNLSHLKDLLNKIKPDK
jgi:hypothetical protein